MPFELNEVKRRIVVRSEKRVAEDVDPYITRGLPCPSSEVRAAESGEVARQHLLKKVCNVRTYP